jgi:uncharacterized membrane protein YecN with MAPEG domain
MVVPLPALGIVMFYTGLNALLALVLAVLVSRQRARSKTIMGAGGNPALERAIRAHGNLVEYAPLVLLMLLLLALSGLGALWLNVLGIAFTAGRVLHAWGLSTSPRESVGRAAGISLTWLTMGVAVVLCLVRGAASLGVGAGIVG